MNAQSAVRKRLLAACVLVGTAAASPGLRSQQPPQPTDLPEHPFFIKNDWIIGGTGPWDYLTVDPTAQRLFIAHGHAMQAVDITSGQVAGTITGLVDAHSIALDDTGQFGYISDGPAARVIVFDRRSLEKVAAIESSPNPRALVFEPQTKLLFVIRADPGPAAPAPTRGSQTTTLPVYRTQPERPPAPGAASAPSSSSITVIDTLTQTYIGQIVVGGTLGFAQADGRGAVYVIQGNSILRIDAQSVAERMRKTDDGGTPAVTDTPHPAPKPVMIDWTAPIAPIDHKSFNISRLAGCNSPKGLAIDGAHSRLFTSCAGRRMVVINADTGERVASLPTGDGVEAIGYDANHGLIYAANGGADGSLTIISQSVADTYAVVQNLVTRQRARTLAVNPESGQVFLVTDLLGVNLAAPAAAQFTLHTNSVNGSFQVLVVGN